MSNLDGYWILSLRLTDGKCDLLDWKPEPFSKREIKRAYRRFKGDGDVECACNIGAERFFNTRQEMIKHFRN